jgi:hypothetical protein
MIREEYGDGLRGQLFEFAHFVCETEADAAFELKRSDRGLAWKGDRTVFGGTLALDLVKIEYPWTSKEQFHIEQFKLKVEDYEAIQRLSDPLPDPVFLEMDAEMLQLATGLFAGHDHDACRDLARLEAEQREKDRAMNRLGR